MLELLLEGKLLLLLTELDITLRLVASRDGGAGHCCSRLLDRQTAVERMKNMLYENGRHRFFTSTSLRDIALSIFCVSSPV